MTALLQLLGHSRAWAILLALSALALAACQTTNSGVAQSSTERPSSSTIASSISPAAVSPDSSRSVSAEGFVECFKGTWSSGFVTTTFRIHEKGRAYYAWDGARQGPRSGYRAYFPKATNPNVWESSGTAAKVRFERINAEKVLGEFLANGASSPSRVVYQPTPCNELAALRKQSNHPDSLGLVGCWQGGIWGQNSAPHFRFLKQVSSNVYWINFTWSGDTPGGGNRNGLIVGETISWGVPGVSKVTLEKLGDNTLKATLDKFHQGQKVWTAETTAGRVSCAGQSVASTS